MNKMKRVFSLVLAFAIVLGTFGSVVPAFAETVDAPVATEELRVVPEDVIGTEYEDAIRRLVAFGLIEGYPDGTYKPEREINRAQMAKLLVYALGLDDAVRAAEGQSTGFSDVKGDYWAAGYINVASGQNLIKGYPNGTFKPAEKVTYAHALTMLVRALGYQDDFLPGNWPGNYVSKAADVGITKGLRLPAQSTEGSKRGIVAQLINNTLDAKVVKVDKYTQGTVDYYETDIPLLKDKLEISKYEDTRVIADKIVDDGLAQDELRVKFLRNTPGFDKRDRYDRGEIVKDTYAAGSREVYRFENNVNPRETIGEEVTTYVNDKDKVVHVEREYDDKAYFDFVEKIKEEKLDLVKFDREYEFETSDRDANRADMAVAHVFNDKDDRFDVVDSKSDLEKLSKDEDLVGRMGKFVVKNNRIVYAEILNPAEVNSEWLLVLKNDDGLIEGVSDQTENFKIDLRKDKDYDNSIVYNTKGEKVDLKDIETGNIIYVQEQDYDGDDVALVTVVQDNKVEGEAGRVKTDRIEIGGKSIKVVKSKKGDTTSYHSYYTVDDYDEVKKWDVEETWEDDMEDAYEQEVIAYTDAVGRIAFLNVAGGNSGYKFGIVTRTYADGDRVRIYTTIDGKDGKDTIFKADKERDLTAMVSAVDGKTVKQSLLGSAVKFRLNADGEIADGKFYVMPHSEKLTMEYDEDFGKDVIKTSEKGSFVVTSDNITVISAEGVLAEDTKESQGNLDGFVYADGSKVDVDDFDIATWGDIKEDKYDANLEFFVFTRENKEDEVDGLVFIGKDGANTGSDEVAVYILDKWRAGDDIKVEYVTHPENKKQTRVIDEDGDSLRAAVVNKEKAYVGKEKSNGKLSLIAPNKDTGKTEDFKVVRGGKVNSVKGNYVTVNDVRYYMSGALIYDEDNSKTSSFLKEGQKVDLVLEGIRARVIGYEGLYDGKVDEKDEDLKDGEYTFKGIADLKDGLYAVLEGKDGKSVEVLVDAKLEDKVRKLDRNTVIEPDFITVAGNQVLVGFEIVKTDKPVDPEEPVEPEEPVDPEIKTITATVEPAPAGNTFLVNVDNAANVEKITAGGVELDPAKWEYAFDGNTIRIPDNDKGEIVITMSGVKYKVVVK